MNTALEKPKQRTATVLACTTSASHPLTLFRNKPKVCAEGESQNPAPLMLYLGEHCLGATHINGGWCDAETLLAIPKGR
jgi:hypothetical protein